jgi:hypothetical protein
MWNFLCDTEIKGSLGESNRQDSINQKKIFPDKANPFERRVQKARVLAV